MTRAARSTPSRGPGLNLCVCQQEKAGSYHVLLNLGLVDQHIQLSEFLPPHVCLMASARDSGSATFPEIVGLVAAGVGSATTGLNLRTAA